jgi:acyl-ACP thioesterase
LFCYRDFVITTATDTLVGLATSTWFVVDTQNRKPQKTATYIDLDSTTTGKRVFSRFAQKLKPISDVDQQKTLFVRYSDLDVNEHVNNAQFIKFLTDGLELSFLNTHELSELEINYMAEAQLDDKLSVGSTTNGDECIHQIIREKDETELVRARTVWRN